MLTWQMLEDLFNLRLVNSLIFGILLRIDILTGVLNSMHTLFRLLSLIIQIDASQLLV